MIYPSRFFVSGSRSLLGSAELSCVSPSVEIQYVERMRFVLGALAYDVLLGETRGECEDTGVVCVVRFSSLSLCRAVAHFVGIAVWSLL